MDNWFKKGIIDCIPTLFGYMGIGIAAGVIGTASGLSLLEISLLAIIVYAGAAQFIITSLLVITAPMTVIILTVFLINLRHLLMSMAIAPYVKKLPLSHNIAIGSLLTDETFAVIINAITQQKKLNAKWIQGLNITAYLAWILSCVIGALIGNWLPNPYQFGLDFSLVAMFIGLVYLQLITDKKKTKWHNLIVMMLVIILVIIFMKYMMAELALLFATLLGCLTGVLIQKCQCRYIA